MCSKKIPFDYGLFNGAMVHIIGREPDESTRYGLSGYYVWQWYIDDEKQRYKFASAMAAISRWMKYFELEWPESRLELGSPRVPSSKYEGKTCLEVIIQFKVKGE